MLHFSAIVVVTSWRCFADCGDACQPAILLHVLCKRAEQRCWTMANTHYWQVAVKCGIFTGLHAPSAMPCKTTLSSLCNENGTSLQSRQSLQANLALPGAFSETQLLNEMLPSGPTPFFPAQVVEQLGSSVDE